MHFVHCLPLIPSKLSELRIIVEKKTEMIRKQMCSSICEWENLAHRAVLYRMGTAMRSLVDGACRGVDWYHLWVSRSVRRKESFLGPVRLLLLIV
ncbi:hypothetical protein BHE74_00034402 [Ensete ventricosum]|uniref:Uncharacterized protein n=1 Tax=Ensete ventricosum TaxID=4639 RepID=A0A444CBG4_ENSVE|nr:hypothetical protein GW17_00055195 [Ensete ventricosum]RWW58701.1 hypothetical protein BHE74_00034402 [Ensete ventricosum]RZR73352.1 hypothetical protein BHM03_00023005 [Ensete ventricosum]